MSNPSIPNVPVKRKTPIRRKKKVNRTMLAKKQKRDKKTGRFA